MTFISLNESAARWAETIVNSDNSRYAEAVEKIDKAGFNIKTEAGKFTDRIS